MHFYLYKKADILDEVIKALLAKFSYNTRKSSVKFCKSLLKLDLIADEKPSSTIKAQDGKFEEKENLNNDPTIKAILNMLDWIFKRTKSKKDIKKLANNLDYTTFDLSNIGDFGLDEDLYIKMNAKGKQLSKYENLKSFIEKNDKISKNQKLLIHIDTIWSDYFWSSDTKSFDVKGCNFLHYATLFFKLKKLDSKILEKEK